MKKVTFLVISLMLLTNCSDKDKIPDSLWGTWVVYRIDSITTIAGGYPMNGTLIRRLNDIGILTLNIDSTASLAIQNARISCGITGFEWRIKNDAEMVIDLGESSKFANPVTIWYDYIDKHSLTLYWPAICRDDRVIGVDPYYKFYLNKE